MKIVTVHFTSQVIPFAIFYCDKVVESDDRLEIVVSTPSGSIQSSIIITEYSYFNEIDYNTYEEQKVAVSSILEFIINKELQ